MMRRGLAVALALSMTFAGGAEAKKKHHKRPAVAAICPPPGNNTGSTGVPDARVAQTFIAFRSGKVTSAWMIIDKPDGSTGDFLFQIRTADALGPTNTVLASATVPGTAVPDTQSVVTANFAPTASLVRGQLYALVVRIPDSGTLLRDWQNNPFCSGNLFGSANGVAPFADNFPTFDLVYAVFVQPTKKHHRHRH